MVTRIRTERKHSEEVGEQHRIDLAVKAMQARNLWPIVLNVTQKHNMQPRMIFDVNHHTRPARGETWIALIDQGVEIRDIAQWWGMTRGRVSACLGVYRRNAGYTLLRVANGDETTPRLVNGRGDRRDDCARYDDCLAAVSRGYDGYARCPHQCSGYVKLRLDVMDFVHAKTGTDKYAAPTKGGWASD